MTTDKPTHILVLSDRSAADPALLAAIRARAAIHVDLPHRLRHLKLPITTVDATPPAAG